MLTNFIIQANTQNEQKYMRQLIDFVCKLFIEIFGAGALSKEQCIIYNDASANCPMLVRECNHKLIHPICIRLNCSDLSYWAQFIFQFSHELTHYVIRQYKVDKSAIIKWFEETICEAMSLYIVKLAGERWTECELASVKSSFGNSLVEYYQNKYNTTAESALSNCKSLSDLKELDQCCESNRVARSIERNYLFDSFVSMPYSIQSLVYYPLFMRGDLSAGYYTVNFADWTSSSNYSPLVDCLQNIQPKFA
ncbi:MAG: hypothetical protein LBM98_11145 [Oscillospiraceae bacterium]|jgi:hypothetical protein|nr:hypothetical protein [Oscillospiraceae bacterium]